MPWGIFTRTGHVVTVPLLMAVAVTAVRRAVPRNRSDLHIPRGLYCFLLFVSAEFLSGPALSLDTRINYGLNWIFACKLSFARPLLFPLITVRRLLYVRTLLPTPLPSLQSQLRNNCFCRKRKVRSVSIYLTVLTVNFFEDDVYILWLNYWGFRLVLST